MQIKWRLLIYIKCLSRLQNRVFEMITFGVFKIILLVITIAIKAIASIKPIFSVFILWLLSEF